MTKRLLALATGLALAVPAPGVAGTNASCTELASNDGTGRGAIAEQCTVGVVEVRAACLYARPVGSAAGALSGSVNATSAHVVATAVHCALRGSNGESAASTLALPGPVTATASTFGPWPGARITVCVSGFALTSTAVMLTIPEACAAA